MLNETNQHPPITRSSNALRDAAQRIAEVNLKLQSFRFMCINHGQADRLKKQTSSTCQTEYSEILFKT